MADFAKSTAFVRYSVKSKPTSQYALAYLDQVLPVSCSGDASEVTRRAIYEIYLDF